MKHNYSIGDNVLVYFITRTYSAEIIELGQEPNTYKVKAFTPNNNVKYRQHVIIPNVTESATDFAYIIKQQSAA